MTNLFKNQNGMNIVGQGGKIILFTLPSLVAAILAHLYLPQVAALPWSASFIKSIGYLWLIPGLVLWATAIIQLFIGFPKGKLVTTGAYSVARNPIYSSATFFILPAVSLITLTWAYLAVSVFLYVGVMLFIGKEEEQLTKVFGKDYEDYKVRVNRLVPIVRERRSIIKVLLICGILSFIFSISTDIFASSTYPGYNFTSQQVSELSAIGAPTRPFLVATSFVWAMLVIAFAVGVWLKAGADRRLRVTAVLLATFAGIGESWALFAPMNQPGSVEILSNSATDVAHLVFTVVQIIVMVLFISLGSRAGGKCFRRYSISTIAAMLAFGGAVGTQVAKIAAGEQTPWLGLIERVSVYAPQLWLAILAVVLLSAVGSEATLASTIKP